MKTHHLNSTQRLLKAYLQTSNVKPEEFAASGIAIGQLSTFAEDSKTLIDSVAIEADLMLPVIETYREALRISIERRAEILKMQQRDCHKALAGEHK